MTEKKNVQYALKGHDLALFMEQLSIVAASNLPMPGALRQMAEDLDNAAISVALRAVASRLEAGESLDNALQSSGVAVPPLFTSLVRAGERVGSLPRVLARLCAFSHRSFDTQKHIQEALAYPIFLMISLCVFVVCLGNVVIPQFRAIFNSFSAQLPLPTQLCFGIYDTARDAVVSPLVYLIAVLCALTIGFVWMTRVASYGREKERFILRLPFFKTLYRASVVERFSRCVSMLIENKVPANEAVVLAGAATGSHIYEDASKLSAEQIAAGTGIADALSNTGGFRGSYLWIVRNAEQNGTLAAAFEALADAYEREVERRRRMFLAAITPAFTIVMGLTVGFVVVAMFMPVFQLSTIVGK